MMEVLRGNHLGRAKHARPVIYPSSQMQVPAMGLPAASCITLAFDRSDLLTGARLRLFVEA